jgi:glycosyltransferase involved in cell wall biosynthesis
MTKTNSKLKISVVVPVYNEEDNLEYLVTSIIRSLVSFQYEIIFIDDGSVDSSVAIIKKLSKRNKAIHFLSFSRNFGHQAALRAGLLYAKGDAVISMDADMQHPPTLLPKLISKWQEGYEVVNTIRNDNNTKFSKKVSSSVFYGIMNKLGDLNMEKGSADFRLLDRKVVAVINDQAELGLFLRGYINWIGFKQISVEYTPNKRHSGESKYSIRKMFTLAANGITQFSIKPLRVAFSLSLIAFIIAVVYSVYAVWVTLFTTAGVKGWASLVVLFVFLEGLQFLLIGLLGEYIGRTFMQTKGRPEFIVRETDLNK